MINYLLLCMLTAQAIWAAPAVLSDVASHIVIVTPQAQVHLDPAGGPFIQHLSPLARFAAPHEETIVYVPASAAAPILHTSSDGGRSSSLSEQQQPLKSETKQYENAITQIQQAIQQGSSMFGPQFSEAAAAAAAAASSAGSGFFPAFFPPPNSNKDDDKLKPAEKLEYETPAATKPLLAESRRFYALSPALPQIVDFVHAPIFLSAIRARSLQEAEKSEISSIAAPLLPETAQPEELSLKTNLKEDIKTEELSKDIVAELEKKTDFGRFLEANALKEEIKKEPIEQDLKRDNLKPELELTVALPQNLAIPSDLNLPQPIIDAAANIAVPIKAFPGGDLAQPKAEA